MLGTKLPDSFSLLKDSEKRKLADVLLKAAASMRLNGVMAVKVYVMGKTKSLSSIYLRTVFEIFSELEYGTIRNDLASRNNINNLFLLVGVSKEKTSNCDWFGR